MSKPIDDGGPAFPGHDSTAGPYSGITYRQWLVGVAMQGYCGAKDKHPTEWNGPTQIASMAHNDADAIIAHQRREEEQSTEPKVNIPDIEEPAAFTTPTKTTEEPTDEREAFEEWAKSRGSFGRLERGEHRDYKYVDVQEAWEVWQARGERMEIQAENRKKELHGEILRLHRQGAKDVHRLQDANRELVEALEGLLEDPDWNRPSISDARKRGRLALVKHKEGGEG